MAKRSINIKAKAKEINDSLEQVNSGVIKSTSLANKLTESLKNVKPVELPVIIKTSSESGVSNIQKQAESVEKVTETIKKTKEKLASAEADSKELVNKANNIKKSTHDWKKTIESALDVKITTPSSLDATKITKPITDLQKQITNNADFETIENIKVQIGGLVDKITGLSDIWQRFVNSADSVKGLASDLSTSVNSIFPKVKSGTPVPAFKGTVFGAFGELIDNINASIDENQLKRFEATAASLRTFTLSLKEMIAVNKDFDTVKEFISKVSTPSEGETIAPIKQIAETLTTYVSEIGGLTARTTNLSTKDDGSSSIKQVINAKVQGIKDVIATIVPLTEGLKGLADQNVPKGISNLVDATTDISNFIEFLAEYGNRNQKTASTFEEGGSTWTLTSTIEKKLSDDVQGVRDVLSTINLLSTDLKKMAENSVEKGIENIDSARTALENFITKLSEVGKRDSVETKVTKDTGLFNFAGNPITETETKIKSELNVKIQSVRDILDTVRILSTDLTKLSTQEVKNGITAVDNANTSLYKFINELGSLGERSPGKLDLKPNGDGTFILEFKRDLNSKVQGVQDILDAIGSLSGRLQKMADQNIPTGIENLGKAQEGLTKFINELGELGMRKGAGGGGSDGGDGGSTGGGNWNPFADELKTTLNDKVQGVRDILRTISILTSDLEKLTGNKIAEGLRVIDASRDKLYEFINKLGTLGEPTDVPTSKTTLNEDGSITETKGVKSLLNSKVQGVKDILHLVEVLANDLSKLSEQGIRTGISNLESARTGINTFIDSLWSLGKLKENKEQGVDKEVSLVLNQKMQGVNAVLSAIKVLTGQLTSLKDNTLDALAALDLVKEELPKFMKDISDFAGLHDVTTYKNGMPETKSVLSDRIQGFIAITNILKPFASTLSELNVSNDYEAKINHVKNALQTLLSAFTPETDTDTKKLTDSANNINVVSGALKNLGNVLPKLSLPKEALGNDGSIKATAQNIYDLLDAFRTMDVQAGLNNMEVVSNMLAKYAGVLKSMSKIGTIDFSKLQSDFTQFVNALNVLASSNALKEMPQDNADRFGALGRALKGISSFINSMVKGGDFSGFTTNIQTAIPAITDFINQMSRLSTLSTFPDFERVAKSLGSFNGRLHETNSTVEHTSRGMIRLKSIMRQVYTAFVGGAVVYSIVRTIKNAVKEMYNLEYAMARVNTIARVSSSELKNLTHYVQEMSAQYGVASSKVTKALYDINSATIKGQASMKILEQSLKLAVAGFADIEKVTDLIAKAVNAYEYSASEAAKISDILFVTVERGINPMEELSEYMGRMFTVAANAGVSLEEVGAGLATLTARGYQTNVASTALNSAILKLSAGTKELNKLFQQYGYASSASALRTMGLTGALQVLYKATNGATEKLHDLGFNYRDIRAATTLASGAISEYNKTLALMSDETYKNGLTNKALAEVQDTVIFKFNRLKETYTVFIQSISEYINKNDLLKKSLDTLANGIENVTKSMHGFGLSAKEQFSAGLTTLIPKLLLAYAIFKPMQAAFSGLLIPFHALINAKKSVVDLITTIKSTEAPLKSIESEVFLVSKNVDAAKISVDGITHGVYSFKTSVEGASKSVGIFLTYLQQLSSSNAKYQLTPFVSAGNPLSVGNYTANLKKIGNVSVNPEILGKNLGVNITGNGQFSALDTKTFKNLASTSMQGYSANVSKVIKDSVGNDIIAPYARFNKYGNLKLKPVFGEYFGGEGNTSTLKNWFIQRNLASTGRFGRFVQINPKVIPSYSPSFGYSQYMPEYQEYAKKQWTVNPSALNIGLKGSGLARQVEPLARSVSSLTGVQESDFGLTPKGSRYDLKVPVKGLKELAEEAKKAIKTADNAKLSVTNLSSGFNAVNNSAKKADASAKSLSTSFEAFNKKIASVGATIGSAVKQAGMFALNMAAVQGVMTYFVGSIAELKAQDFGFFESVGMFFSSWENAWSGLVGVAGRFIDILDFGLTNLGEKWSLWAKAADYVDLEAIKQTRDYQGDFSKSAFAEVVSRQISAIKNFDLISEGLSEDRIMKVYNTSIDAIQNEARYRKVSKETLETAIKVASEQKDLLLSYNDTLKKLLPNTQALDDVFEQACKNIEEAAEKFATPMEKQLSKMRKAQEAISKLAELTGFSERQLRAAGSSPASMQSLKERWKKQQDEFASKLSDFINSQQVDVNFVYTKNLNKAKKDMEVKYNELSNAIIDAGYSKDSVGEVLEKLKAGESFGYYDASGSFKNLGEMYNTFASSLQKLSQVETMSELDKASLGFNDYMSKISMFFSEDEYKALVSQKDKVVALFAKIPESIKNDAEKSNQFIAKGLRDILANPEIAKQFDVLGSTYLEAIQETEKYRKSINSLGLEMSKMQAQFKTNDIFKMFNLTSVQDITEGLMNKLYAPEDIDKVNTAVVTGFMKVASEGITKNMSLADLTSSIITAFREDSFLSTLDEEELKDKADIVIAAVQQASSFVKEFASQLSELDYTKVMRRMQFGSDMSHFKAYKTLGKDLISNLMGIDIYGSDFGTLLHDFEADKSKFGFDTARTNFRAKFGEAGESAWTTFASLFKDLASYEQQFISPLQTEYRNSKKRIYNFMKNYEDAFLTPIQRLNKLENKLKGQVSKLRAQAKEGTIDSDLVSKIVDNMEQVQKLNAESMTMKVPSAITASEAVKTGSKEAFDLVASNVFRDMYKVNQEQLKRQNKLVELGTTVNNLLNKAVSNINPMKNVVTYGG